MLIFNLRPGGWVKGPNISGRFGAPGSDWLRIMPSGIGRIDAKCLMETDDGEPIYFSYNGVLKQSEESAERLNSGQVLTFRDIPYFITAPAFQTSSKRYSWLNEIQAVNKMTELKFGTDGYVRYDVFAIR